MRNAIRLAGICFAWALSTSAHSELAPRDLTGDGIGDALYDTVNDLTWLRDADRNGGASQLDQLGWAAGLQVSTYADWRLPSAKEMLGLLAANGYHSTLASQFEHLQYIYWTSDIVPFGQPLGIWVTTDFGNTFIAQSQWSASAMAVTPGDIGFATSVPEPETWLLTVAGLSGLSCAWARRAARKRPPKGRVNARQPATAHDAS